MVTWDPDFVMGSRFLKRLLRRHVGFWLRGGFFASREDGSVVELLSPFLVREVLFCVGVMAKSLVVNFQRVVFLFKVWFRQQARFSTTSSLFGPSSA